MTERWLPIPGYEGRYDVSDLGRVRSWLSPRPRYKGSLPRLLKQVEQDAGYYQVTLHRDLKQRTVRVHCLVALAFIGPLPEGQETRHRDGNGLHNALSNLRYGTSQQNRGDASAHGTLRNRNTGKTECINGHPFDAANTYVGPDGSRQCRTCQRARRASYLQRKGAIA